MNSFFYFSMNMKKKNSEPTIFLITIRFTNFLQSNIIHSYSFLLWNTFEEKFISSYKSQTFN